MGMREVWCSGCWVHGTAGACDGLRNEYMSSPLEFTRWLQYQILALIRRRTVPATLALACRALDPARYLRLLACAGTYLQHPAVHNAL